MRTNDSDRAKRKRKIGLEPYELKAVRRFDRKRANPNLAKPRRTRVRYFGPPNP